MPNEKFTQKDLDELISIEAMALQLMEKAKALRIKFGTNKEEKLSKQRIKRELKKQESEARIKDGLRKHRRRMIMASLKAGNSPRGFYNHWPEDSKLIDQAVEEYKKIKPR